MYRSVQSFNIHSGQLRGIRTFEIADGQIPGLLDKIVRQMEIFEFKC